MLDGIDGIDILLKKYQERLTGSQRELIENFMGTVGFEITPWQPTFSQCEMDCHTIHNIELLLTRWFCILETTILDIAELIPNRDIQAGELNNWFVAFDKMMTNHPTEPTKDKCEFMINLMKAGDYDLYFISTCSHLIADCASFNFKADYPKLLEELKSLRDKNKGNSLYDYSRGLETLIQTWANAHANLALMHHAPCVTTQYEQHSQQQQPIIYVDNTALNTAPLSLKRHNSF